jgi:hypothetical protein
LLQHPAVAYLCLVRYTEMLVRETGSKPTIDTHCQGGGAGVLVKWIAGVRDGVRASLMELWLPELEVSNDHVHLGSVGRPSMGSKGRPMVPIRVVEIAQPEVDVEPRATRCRDEFP